MTTGGLLITCLSLSTGGLISVMLIPTSPESLPWKELIGGGTASLMLLSMYLFLKFLKEERTDSIEERRKERETIEKITAKYSESIDTQRQRFDETQTTLLRIIEGKK